MRGLLRGVERSSGSSGWLADLYREGERTGAHYEAIWNYEAVIKETNDKLVADRKEPLYAIYPEDGVSVGDSPLGFVDRGRGKEVESFFNDLQAFLLKSETQARIAATGRRVELGRAAPLKADATTNLDPEPRAHGGPAAGACRDSEGAGALSGSTAAAVADRAVPRRVRQHAGPRRAAAARSDAVPVDAGADPRGAGTMVEGGPRSSCCRSAIACCGPRRLPVTTAEQAALLARTLQLRADGGTDFYTCGARALAAMKPFLDRDQHLPAIVIMTDGKSQGAMSTFEQRGVPMDSACRCSASPSVTDADRSQLDSLAAMTGGRVFDGTKSLTQAFRAVRGYN